MARSSSAAAARISIDQALADRARAVVPGGVYGHQSAANLPDGFPQFFARGEGSHLWDVDGKLYIDYMCGFGPIVLGYRHPAVEEAVARQQAMGDCFNGPTERWVELAELLVNISPSADWAWFAKNGTDATTYCVSVAREHTGRRQLLRASGAYHGAAPWCTPRPNGTTPEDTANQITYTFNDIESVHAAAGQAGNDLAAIIVSPYKHDARFDQEDLDIEFARELRRICDETGALLILDDVRAGFRLNLGGSWSSIGVHPDLSAYCKAIANGYPLAAVIGADSVREAAARVYATGSYWFSGVPMAAAIATIETLRDTDAIDRMHRLGIRLRIGLQSLADRHDLAIVQSGPPQIPFLTFASDKEFERAVVFSSYAAKGGAYLHPFHNWFLGASHSKADIDQTLEIADTAFRAVREKFGSG